MKTKWLVNNNLSCVDNNMDFACSKDVYWKCVVDEDDNIITVASPIESCKKHYRSNYGVEMKSSKVDGYRGWFGFIESEVK